MVTRFELFGSVLLSACSAAASAAGGENADFWKAAGEHGAVVAGGAEAADAAIRTLQRGNAIDAAVSALLVLSVTDSGNFCFGGEVPILVYDAPRKVVEVIAGQGVAPWARGRRWWGCMSA